MEKASPRTLYHCLSLAELVGFLLLDSILIWITRLQKLSQRLIPTSSSRIHDEKAPKTNTSTSEVIRGDHVELRREDVEMIMERMGMSFSPDQAVGFDELPTMFEEKEPSLEEVKEAFCVFDENCDGFIDAAELQTVLCKLGFGEGVDMDACKLMIAAHDENGDARIDFNEFVKFMESSFC